ncbi:translation initiation factor IF-3 [Ochlerotatus camptorhynchus]|uniref:translation initiation factor IF-3 n=1 Tax=Ochlerotatus camptorhynchus TaxID=644619 RepID=UPI0031CEA558
MNVLGRIVRTTFHYRSSLAASSRALPAAVSNFVQYASKSSKSPADVGGAAQAGTTPATAVRKPKTAPKITLVGPDQAVSIVSLDEAQKISKRRDLKLVKIVDLDMKTQRPVYKLMSSAEYLEEDLKRREEKKRTKQEAAIKGDKLLNVSARITEHDLMSKIHHVQKWLTKQYEVRIIISGDGDKSKQEAVATKFENWTKDVGKIVQKRFRDSDLRFQILPVNNPVENAPPEPSAKKPVLEAKQSSHTTGGQQSSVRALHTERKLA